MRQHLVGAGTSLIQKNQRLMRIDVYIRGFENIKKSDRVNSAGRAAYVERNYWMINDSDFVVVHLDEERNAGKSGTRLAYKYSLRQKKCMITVLK